MRKRGSGSPRCSGSSLAQRHCWCSARTAAKCGDNCCVSDCSFSRGAVPATPTQRIPDKRVATSLFAFAWFRCSFQSGWRRDPSTSRTMLVSADGWLSATGRPAINCVCASAAACCQRRGPVRPLRTRASRRVVPFWLNDVPVLEYFASVLDLVCSCFP